jgi:hypothetical protein
MRRPKLTLRQARQFAPSVRKMDQKSFCGVGGSRWSHPPEGVEVEPETARLVDPQRADVEIVGEAEGAFEIAREKRALQAES